MIEKTEKLFTTFCTRLVSLFLYLMKATDDGSMAASETRINIEYLWKLDHFVNIFSLAITIWWPDIGPYIFILPLHHVWYAIRALKGAYGEIAMVFLLP